MDELTTVNQILASADTFQFDIGTELILFLEQGGNVLVVIMATTFMLWMLILERYYYFWKPYRQLRNNITEYWSLRGDKSSWCAHKIRERLLSVAKIKSEKNLSMIKAVIVIAPLLGLLGTVVGMIEVFDALSLISASNARAMASGVSKATIPTMAGMVVSLVGLLFDVNLQRKAKFSAESLAGELTIHDVKRGDTQKARRQECKQ